MDRATVQGIYDTLFSTESKLKRQHSYPIHKRLNPDILQYADIYEWISQEVNFTPKSNVLDAGCGVGYGSMLLASQHDIRVTGISLSDLEIVQARKVATSKNLDQRVKFQLQSFDDLAEKSFDVIIAVESVKHSFDLQHTLQVLVNALKPNGQLLIVEDFYLQKELTKTAKKYVKDWKLLDAFRFEDYFQVLSHDKCQLTDLTASMFLKNKRKIQFQLALSNIFQITQKAALSRIFRGGFYLDQLYAERLMKYQVLQYYKH